jgi:NADH-quinone oxidoreductase subunit E
MVMIFKDTFEDLTPEQLEQIIDRFEAGKGAEVTPGPQIDRIYSAPEGGLTSLMLADPAPAKAATSAKKVSDAPAVSVPPSNAGRVKTAASETNASLKTPATAKAEAAANAKVEGDTVDKSKPVKAAAVAGKPSLEDKNRPAGIEKPAAVDDLKLISGVGPKIEGTLNELGIYTYAQVASWKKAEREWVDGYLNFKGRIERDDWVKQAKALAKGGEAEYIKVFGKKPR